ncbi:MAG: NAD(P)/FAD-dependent oxidoreductase [Deltaproteobacteria bacterium HGW-Deltaproteobacteria-1]|jgi:dihydrolipoamide dehydrogenase|nr:MAG: NAD(P)/FAD-dependent oxidoreductase [Deltaproteobacteria bacterium HGW-Deltaproteobacteria-1]
MSKKIDVVVIGGGPGGTPAAMHMASKGKKVLLVEKAGKLGGACLFVGCIPSKIIKHAADEYDALRNKPAGDRPFSEDAGVFWKEIRARMDSILSMRSAGALQRLTQIPQAMMIAGSAKFTSNHEIEIEGMNGERSVYGFDHAIIATGSIPVVPPFKGDAVQDVLTTELLFKQETLPPSVVIIGGGPIGVELAQMLTKLTVKCTIIEMLETILPGVVEPEFAEELAKKLAASGIDVFTSAKVLEVNRSGGNFTTTFIDGAGGQRTVRSEKVLAAAGRMPNLKDLHLEATDIRFDRQGIAVDDYLQPGVSGIYAVGDVIHGPKFAHTATYEAYIAAVNILMGQNVQKADLSKNSWVLFSDPEIASAGYTTADALKNNHDILTGSYDYKIDATAQINRSPFGYLKFVVDKKSLAIVGIHIFAPGASSIAGEAALIVAKNMTLQDVAQTIHPHPTLTEAFGFLAMNMLMGK